MVIGTSVRSSTFPSIEVDGSKTHKVNSQKTRTDSPDFSSLSDWLVWLDASLKGFHSVAVGLSVD